MPLGVEHSVQKEGLDAHHIVPLPLMPLGVEHFMESVFHEGQQVVPLPLMPLGVEHEFALKMDLWQQDRAFTFDAFRR